MVNTSTIDMRELHKTEFFYDIPHPTIKKGNTFRFYEMGIMGVGWEKQKIVSLDDCIDKKMFPLINEEIEKNVPLFKDQWVSMIPKGIVPTHINGEPSLDCLMSNARLLEAYKDDIKDIKSLIRIREKIYTLLNLKKGWRATLQLRHTSNFKNKTLSTTWKDTAVNFPCLQEFITKLPLKSLGYVNIMMYDKNRALPIHRDTFLVPHTEHFININFHTKPKPFFLYDEIKQEKFYLDEKSHCYFFNECDLHGVDAQEEDYFTVRIDCKFQDWFAESLGMTRGYVFDWPYMLGNSPPKIRVWNSN